MRQESVGLAAGVSRVADLFVIRLEQVVPNGFGGWRNGPHPIGWVERTADGVKIRLVSTEAGRTAAALLEEDLLDIVLSEDYPPIIRLTALGR